MQKHSCKYCDEIRICPKPADKCFDEYLICDDCRRIEYFWLLASIVLGFIAAAMTLFLFISQFDFLPKE